MFEQIMEKVSEWGGLTKAFLDYDGTLVDLTSQPEFARPPENLVILLNELKKKIPLYLVTGRDLGGIMALVGKGYNIIALHGAQGIYEDGTKWQMNKFDSFVRRTEELKKKYLRLEGKFPGLRVIDKSGGLQFHYHDVPTKKRKMLKDVILTVKEEGFEMYKGKLIYELRIKGISKGIVIPKFMEEGDFVIFPGDDRTDEEAFKVLKSHVTIKVGKGRTAANFRLNSPTEVKKLLLQLSNDGSALRRVK